MARLTALLLSSTALLLAAQLPAQGLPPVPAPAQNPITPAKAVLGKILFWDEQLSADDTMACGTCHIPGAGGADPVPGAYPGADLIWLTADDGHGSRGVVNRNAAGDYSPEATFGLDRQVTRRIAPSAFTSQWATEQFWDGRAGDTFLDPETGAVVIPTGGSLESQAVGPIQSMSEMAQEARPWSEVTTKLAGAVPLAVATNLPVDVQAALQASPTYPDLFRSAFGDPAISAARIGMALATYERTLVPDQTAWDRWVAGDPTALTPLEQQGLGEFSNALCDQCHTPPQFTDESFRNIGVRPVHEDQGLREVTTKFADRGKFKVPSLRGAALKPRFMHNGRFVTMLEVVDFYARRLPSFSDNQDPLYQSMFIPGSATVPLVAFLENALTDPRMAQELPPFDRPTLRSERTPNPSYGAGIAGPGNTVPRLLGHQPAFVGAVDFRIGVADGRPATPALLVLSPLRGSYPGFQLPVHIDVSATVGLGTVLGAAGQGTWQLPLPHLISARGQTLRAQAFGVDPSGPLGLSASDAVEFPID